MLLQFQVATYPNLKTEKMKGVHNAISKKAYPQSTSNNKKPLTTEQVARIIGVKHGG